MADTKTTLTWLLRDEVSGTAHKIDGALKGAAASGGGASGVFGKLGGAIGSMINPTALAIAGIGALTAGVGLAVKKAMDHEVVLKRLDQVLVANVKGYNGNRDAIDKYISKQTDLGFTVDETTASLAQLTAATHDVSKAQEFLQAAEDLARLKGISLQDATDALTKVEAGRFRGLATLGIVLQKGATATDALRAVQAVAAGQADAYGKTMTGQFSKMNAKFDDAMTKIGEQLMPVLANLAGFFTDTLIPAIEKVIGVIGRMIGWIQTAFEKIGSLITKFKEFINLDQGRGGSGSFDPVTTTKGSGSGGSAAASGSPAVVQLNLDGKVVAQVVDQHLYYMLRGSPATRMRN